MTINEYVIENDFSFLIVRSDKHGVISFLVDTEDVEKLKEHKWVISRCRNTMYDTLYKYYLTSSTDKFLLHRFLTNAPKGSVVNHINGNTLDMRKKNLSVGTYSDNNRKVKHRKWGSDVCGVSFNKNVNKWHPYIGVDGKCISLGYYESKEEAVKVRKEAEAKYGY